MQNRNKLTDTENKFVNVLRDRGESDKLGILD